MMSTVTSLTAWLDNRTGYRRLLHEALYENIPGGARWRYVWGSTLVFAFMVQVVTGIVLWMAYSPSGHTAWESVYYIEHEMQGGSLLRGIHHFTAQAMIVLMALHLMQVVICGAYRAPREFNFWTGLILMQLVLGMSLTGYLLPWDQKAYWATSVATNIMGSGGDWIRQVAVGGSEYGHHTLSRFFAMHAGVLPGLIMLLLVLHLLFFRKHGVCAPNPEGKPDQYFWPDQVLKDAVACLAVLVVVLGLTIWKGADLGAPADAASPYDAARPEWYFLFLFQFLKFPFLEHLPGGAEFGGGVLIPMLVMALIGLMPIVGRWKLGHVFNVGLLFVLLGGAGALTGIAYNQDNMAGNTYNAENPPEKFPDDAQRQEQFANAWQASKNFLEAIDAAKREAERAEQLAKAPAGIPPTGMRSLLRNDAKTQGPVLFKAHCATCHSYRDSRGVVVRTDQQPTAPNLGNFGSRTWIAGLLDPKQVLTQKYFSSAEHLRDGDMAGWVVENVGEFEAEDLEDLNKVVMALSAEAALKSQQEMDEKDADAIAQGRELLKETIGCTDCHKFHDTGDAGLAPDLTGYGSREWLIGMISDPAHERFYGHLDADVQPMPSFAPNAQRPEENWLRAREIALIADWLRGQWYEPLQSQAAE